MKKTIQTIKCAVAILVITDAPVQSQTVTWERRAFGQQQTDPCGTPFNWPNNNNWTQQEVIATACNQTYILEPSNWTTAQYPNGAGVNVILSSSAPTSIGGLAVTLG